MRRPAKNRFFPPPNSPTGRHTVQRLDGFHLSLSVYYVLRQVNVIIFNAPKIISSEISSLRRWQQKRGCGIVSKGYS